MPTRIRRASSLLLALAIILTLPGCVYYNTFFLAKKHYKKAEKLRKKADEKGEEPPATATSEYNITIEKASKVLVFYPQSKYIDDALFLLGMALYRSGDYLKSINKFNELLKSYPDSKYTEDAKYWRAMARLKNGDIDEASGELSAFSGEYAEEAAFALARAFYDQNDMVTAVSLFEKFIKDYPKGTKKSSAAFLLMKIYQKWEQYENILKWSKFIEEKQLSANDYFTSQIMIGDAYLKLGRLQDAFSHFDKMQRMERFASRTGDIQVKLGQIYLARGDTSTAENMWIQVTDNYSRTDAAAWAYYYLGELYLAEGNLEKAKEMFDKATREYSKSDAIALARERSETIAKLTEYRNMLAQNPDSANYNPVVTQLALGELYVLKLNQPDSAIAVYRRILTEHPDDSLAPKAHYSLGWTYSYRKNDIKSADTIFADLLKRYPKTDYAVGAAKYFQDRGASLDSLGARTAAYYFVKGEEFLFTYHWTDSAITYYRTVIDNFPKSIFTPRAYTALGYIYSTIVHNPSVAESLYTQITRLFPGTAYDSLAQIRLGEKEVVLSEKSDKYKKTPASAPAHKREEKTSPDTTSLTEFPWAPSRLEEPLELEYPEQEWSSDMRGKTVILKIFIDPFGEVKEAEIYKSCGNSVIDEAARQALLKARFDSKYIEDISILNNYFLYRVRVQKPKGVY